MTEESIVVDKITKYTYTPIIEIGYSYSYQPVDIEVKRFLRKPEIIPKGWRVDDVLFTLDQLDKYDVIEISGKLVNKAKVRIELIGSDPITRAFDNNNDARDLYDDIRIAVTHKKETIKI